MERKTFEEVAEQVCMAADDKNSAYEIYQVPQISKWRCRVFGIDGYYWKPNEGDEPNWFWRKMQYLCFGNKWVKDEH